MPPSSANSHPSNKKHHRYLPIVERISPGSTPSQWVQCDLRQFDMSVLGKFSVIMADPPWDIHMELPYGTMADDEMRRLDIPSLQDDGYLFLWVSAQPSRTKLVQHTIARLSGHWPRHGTR